jgi:2-hydroxychromene-2-carboxylate isomerase
MTSLARRIAPYATHALTSARTRALRRRLAEGRRRLGGEPHRLRYFHQADDPYSHLAAQALGPLLARYDVALTPYLVGPPSDAAAPDRARLESFSRKDAADVAPAYGLGFPRHAERPGDEDVLLAQRILAASIADGRFVEVVARVGAALWAPPAEASGLLAEIAAEKGTAECAAAREALETGAAERRRLGHYLGATFHYGGEWYWGVDRMHHLERRLIGLGARHPLSGLELVAPRPDPGGDPPVSDREPLALEFFLSLRSPYTYIAMERVFWLARRLPVTLVLRPVLPMVMRGLPVPREKQLYIVLDTKREAEDAGVLFGRVCDPVGRPVERAFSLFRWSRERGHAGEMLLSFARAAFGEGVDTGTDAALRRVVERAGLAWGEARAHLDRDDGWRAELEANRQALLELGLWGVPSFCLRGPLGQALFSTWGQDRLWLVETEIHRCLSGAARARDPSAGPSMIGR